MRVRLGAALAAGWFAVGVGAFAGQQPGGPARPRSRAGATQDANVQDAKAANLRQALDRQLKADVEGVDGVVGFAVLDLTNGDRFGRMQDERFPTASTIKLAIIYELFKQVEEGRLSLDEPRALDPSHVVGGSGILRELAAPSMPLRDYATLMILVSDNTATNVLIDALGMENVNARMAGLGLTNTLLRRRMMDLEAARRGDENISTPGELVRLLEIIYRGEGLTKASHQAMLEILRRPKSSPLRRAIPQNVAVANKPGGLEGVVVDAGIVYIERRPYIVAMMGTYLAESSEGNAVVERAARRVFDYFNRLARSSEYGRRIR